MSPPVPHPPAEASASALFSTVFGTCGIAWNRIGLTGFQLPEDTDTRPRHSLEAKTGIHPASEEIPAGNVGEALRPDFAAVSPSGRGIELLPHGPEKRPASETAAPPLPPVWVRRVMERAQEHFRGRLQDFADIKLDWSRVSDFQRAVYEQTRAIKPGFKRSYGEIAHALALEPGGARAVGAALGANPWPLIVPCHRVVSAGGKMTGFSAPGGVRTKTRLLTLEGAELLSE